MASGFLRKWLGPAKSVSPQIVEALDELRKLGQERIGLAGPAIFLNEILPFLCQEAAVESPPVLTPEQAAAKLVGGVPLLRGESFQVDRPTFRRRWQDICAAVRQQQDGDTGQRLADALRLERLEGDALLRAILAGRPEEVHQLADAQELEPSLTATVLRLALFPVLANINRVLMPLRQGVAWAQGYCPTCGSWPALGEYRGLEQTRFLRCGWCAAAWEFPRLQCPYCGTRDHHVLGYFHVEGEEARHRAATCEACRGYVKMLSTLLALTEPQLLVAEVATLHLDLAAAERGYTVQP